MFRKDQFGIVFNTIFSLMFAIFLPLYIDGSNMFREAGALGAAGSAAHQGLHPRLRRGLRHRHLH